MKMGKPRMIGMKSTFIPNSKADQMNKRFKRKERMHHERQHHVLPSNRADGGGSCCTGVPDLGLVRCEREK